VLVTGVLAQVDEMLDHEERERCCRALNKELGGIEDDIKFVFHKLPTVQFCCILSLHFIGRVMTLHNSFTAVVDDKSQLLGKKADVDFDIEDERTDTS